LGVRRPAGHARRREDACCDGQVYAGPTWEASDGSRFTGKQVGTAPASAGNIRFQLVKAEGGTGAMMGITYIQRLNTNGGAAPADACNASTTGAKNAVRYTAEYVFYEAG